MAYKSKLSLLLCIFSVSLFLSVALAQQCQEKCTKQRGLQQLQCQKRCYEKYREQQRCEEQCLRQYVEEQGRAAGIQGAGESQTGGQQGRENQNENPYFFDSKRFIEHISPEGNISVLEKFTSRSDFLKGIENYRITLFAANPSTVMIPNHWVVDTICVVLKGLGAVTILHENNKETHVIMAGDIFRVRAGATVYTVNTHNESKLYIFELTIPLNNPGRFESFYPLGGKDQESYFSGLSDEVIQAAFNTESGQLRKMFKTTKASFVRASQEQIRAITADMASGHGGQPDYTYHSLLKVPFRSNQYGRLYLTRPEDFKPLQDLDVAISYANITARGMLGPYYNSRSTTIAFVARGNGYFDMACPHLSQQQQGQQGAESRVSYQNVRSKITRSDVFVVPAGDPVAIVSTEEDNLHIVGIELNARDNEKNPLAGSTNIFKQLEREAKELSFDFPVGQVEEIINKQPEAWFFPGPETIRKPVYGMKI